MANELAEKGYQVTALAMENKEGQPFFHVAENVNYINAGVGLKLNFLLGKIYGENYARIRINDICIEIKL